MDITLTAKKIREENYYERGSLIKMTAYIGFEREIREVE